MEKTHKGPRKHSEAHSGGGMPYFNKEHWQKDVSDVETAGGRYAPEMAGAAVYKESVDKLAAYARKHRAQH